MVNKQAKIKKKWVTLKDTVVIQSSVFRPGSDSESTLKEDQQSYEVWIIVQKSIFQ